MNNDVNLGISYKNCLTYVWYLLSPALPAASVSVSHFLLPAYYLITFLSCMHNFKALYTDSQVAGTGGETERQRARDREREIGRAWQRARKSELGSRPGHYHNYRKHAQQSTQMDRQTDRQTGGRTGAHTQTSATYIYRHTHATYIHAHLVYDAIFCALILRSSFFLFVASTFVLFYFFFHTLCSYLTHPSKLHTRLGGICVHVWPLINLKCINQAPGAYST